MGFTDDRTVDLVRKLNSAFSQNKSDKKLVNKLDPGTGTYYADEELAIKKVNQPIIVQTDDKELFKQIATDRTVRTASSKNGVRGYAASETKKDSRWQSSH